MIVALDSEKLVSGDDNITYINTEYRICNDGKNIVIKIEPHDNDKKVGSFIIKHFFLKQK